MGDQSSKTHKIFEASDAATCLRALASAIDSNDSQALLAVGLDLSDSRKIKLSLKLDTDPVVLEVEVKKQSHPGTIRDTKAAPSGNGRPKFKSLKKQMKRTFASIGNSLDAGELPGEQMVNAFVAQSGLMTTYNGPWAEDNDAFEAACAQLKAAFAQKDLRALTEKYEQLRDVKAGCHARYK